MSESPITVADTTTNRTIDLNTLKLPTMSKQGMKALEIINAEDLEFNKLEAAISTDPMLMGILLKYANSPMYSKLIEVKNVRKAINLLGVDIVKAAVIICTMRSYCEPITPAKELLWERSIQLAMLAKLLARKVFRKLADGIELAAMMSQIGGLVLSSNYIKEYATLIEQAEQRNITIKEQEFDVFGVQRADVTEYALQKLRLPQDIIKGLKAFYSKGIPSIIETDIDRYTLILKLSESLIKVDTDFMSDMDSQSLMNTLKLNEVEITKILEAYHEQRKEGFSF